MKYRILKVGEIARNGDEIWDNGDKHWYPCRVTIGATVQGKTGCGDKFRRPIKHRILKSNEIIRERDQAYDSATRGWFNVTKAMSSAVGKPVKELTTGVLSFCHSRIRRKVS
jgi:hypothetical protein